ncbi:MAG: ABC transporter substrate-binding protein [Alphaproteobacteria bacterium]|nr:ABC transporter substrate-binding protein [Alphaproteobacteria bacterium]
MAARRARWVSWAGLIVLLASAASLAPTDVAAQATLRPRDAPQIFQIQPDPGTERELPRPPRRDNEPPPPVSGSANSLVVGHTAGIAAGQLYVMIEAGMLGELGVTLVPRRFPADIEIARSIGRGEIDMGYLDPGSVLKARDEGEPLVIIAAAQVESYVLLARGELARFLRDEDVAGGLRRAWARRGGARITIASLPRDTVAHALLERWVVRNTAFSTEDLRTPGVPLNQLWNALRLGTIEAAVVPEPIVASILESDPTARVVLEGRDLMLGHPTAVVAVRANLLRERPAQVAGFLSRHIAATRYLQDEKERAAPYFAKHAGYGQVKAETFAKALGSGLARYASDPAAIIEPLRLIESLLLQAQLLSGRVNVTEIVDLELHKAAAKP